VRDGLLDLALDLLLLDRFENLDDAVISAVSVDALENLDI